MFQFNDFLTSLTCLTVAVYHIMMVIVFGSLASNHPVTQKTPATTKILKTTGSH